MEQALQEVKAELGPGAIILEARRRRRTLGIFGSGGVEVVAAVDPGLRLISDRGPAAGGPATPPAPSGEPQWGLERVPTPRPAAVRAYHRAALNGTPAPAGGRPPGAGTTTRPGAEPWWVAEFASNPQGAAASPAQVMPDPPARPGGSAEVAVRPDLPAPSVQSAGDLAALLRCDLMPQTAERLLEGGVTIDDPRFARRLEELAAVRLGQAPAGPVRTVAFVGPTGSGKTTSLAKLASRAVLLEGRRVALITLDTYRVGAVDQLQTYAEILDVPLYVAYTAEDLQEAVQRAADADLVLIDTAGRGPSDAVAIARLRKVLAQVPIDETHLVLAASTRVLDAQHLSATYRRLSPNRLLLTKLDETLALGGVLELPAVLGLPVSYLSFGQSVPDDIEPATAQRAAARILDVLRVAREGVGS